MSGALLSQEITHQVLIYRSQGRIGGNIVLTRCLVLTEIPTLSNRSPSPPVLHPISLRRQKFSSPLPKSQMALCSRGRRARARMLCDFTNTDEEATARRALNGVHGAAAAAIHKLSLFLWSSLNAAAAAAADCLSFSVIDARRKLVERG